MAIYSGFFPLKMVIFHSYVSLPEGIADLWIGWVLHFGTQSPSLGHRSEDPQVQELCDYFNIEVWRGMQ